MRVLVGSIAGLVVACHAALAAADSLASADLAPHRLRCEQLVDPLGIDEDQPRLSWALTSSEQGKSQSKYRILVASTRRLLSLDKGDLWDSGEVDSDETTHIVYDGKSLRSGQSAWWKVQSWDEKDRPGPWSKPACWEMGLLSPNDWTGKWIGRDEDTSQTKPLPLLRKTFPLKGKVRRARAYVCGVGYYELYLNGQRIGDARLAPSYTRYDKRLAYNTLDVTEAMREGGNALGIMLGNGWFNVATKAPWRFDEAPWRASPRVLCEVWIEYADGRTDRIVSGDSWKTSPGPITFSCIYGGESHDARLEGKGWSTFDFDDASWESASLLKSPGGKLAADVAPPIRVTKRLKPLRIVRHSDNVYLYDFGQNLCGCVELSVEGAAGSEVRMVYSELLGDDGKIARENIARHVWSHGKSQRFQTDSYTLKGEGREQWSARFTYHGFRYVKVTADPKVLEDLALTACFMHTDMKQVGHFDCSNPLLNKIWNNACWSYLSNFVSIPTDCPHREKNGWTGDAHLACEFGLLNYDGAVAYAKWINDLQDELQPDGKLPGIVPTSGWGYDWGNGPAWDSAFLLIPDYVRTYCGDSRLIERQYQGHRRYVDYLHKASDNLIVRFGLGDWAPWKTETPADLTSTAYFYRDAQIVAQTAMRLGDKQAADHYRDLASRVRGAFNKQYWDKENGGYAPATQTSLSCVLYQGLVDPSQKTAVVNRLVSLVEDADSHIDTGILGSKYLLPALTDNGHAETAYLVASQKTQPSWGWWIEQGATTLWEQWTTADSHNHIMFGDVAAWFTKSLVGLNPDPEAAGFKNIIIRPHPVGDLQWATASHESLRGTTQIAWRREGDQFHLEVDIPANCTATVYLPTTEVDRITERDAPLQQAAHIVLVGVEDGRTKLQIGSGSYSFAAPLEPSRESPGVGAVTADFK